MHSFNMVYSFLPRPLGGGHLTRATDGTAEAHWLATEAGALVLGYAPGFDIRLSFH